MDSLTVAECNLDLLQNEKHCDVAFIVGETRERILSHRLHLMSRSPVFEIMFTKRWKSDREIEEIEIPDVEPFVFRQFLQYLYGDKFPITKVDKAFDILYVADKYQVVSLIKRCENLLAAKIKLKNVISIYQTARLYNLSLLKKRAGDFMARGMTLLLDQPSFQSIDEDTLLHLLSRDDLLVNELKLFDALLRRSHVQLGTETPDSSEQRRVLTKILPLVRFSSMNIQDFEMKIIPTGVLTSDESTALLKYMNSEEPERDGMRASLGFRWQPRSPQVSEHLLDVYWNDWQAKDRQVKASFFKRVTDHTDVTTFSIVRFARSKSLGFTKTAFITSIILRGPNYTSIPKNRSSWRMMNSWKVSLKLEEIPKYWGSTTSAKTMDNLGIFSNKDTVVDISPPFPFREQYKYKISVSYSSAVYLPDVLKLVGSGTHDCLTSTMMRNYTGTSCEFEVQVHPNTSRNDYFPDDEQPVEEKMSSHCIRCVKVNVNNH